MDICVLSSREVGRLVNYGALPCHSQHRHIPYSQAVHQLGTGQLDLVEGYDDMHYVTQAKIYYLQMRDSGHIPVCQRVLSNHPKHITPARFTPLR